ncbi:MAG: hypothetical protein K2F87_00295 [Muribaculaceae bacterium]|nr:hypothetical protein [Muribaculaceae bacterium]
MAKMKLEKEEREREAAAAVDGFIASYGAEGFLRDLESLTPVQRINLYSKALTLRLPKYKAIDVTTGSGLDMEEVEAAVGRMLRGVTPRR